MKPLKLRVVKPNPESPREVNKEVIDGLSESLSRFGYVEGHERAEISKKVNSNLKKVNYGPLETGLAPCPWFFEVL